MWLMSERSCLELLSAEKRISPPPDCLILSCRIVAGCISIYTYPRKIKPRCFMVPRVYPPSYSFPAVDVVHVVPHEENISSAEGGASDRV